MDDPWHELTNYESRDLVFESFKRRHGRELNVAQLQEITASFIQAREYFGNAARAAISVRPLLQYYGVASLTRALILTVSAVKKAEALKPSHGLQPVDWNSTFASGGLQAFGDLAVAIRHGTFSELLEATENTAYLKGNSNGVTWGVSFPRPNAGEVFSFKDIVAALPEVASDYQTWSAAKLISAPITSMSPEVESGTSVILIPRYVEAELVHELFAPNRNGITVTTASDGHRVTVPIDFQPLFGQQITGMLGIGEIHILRPIRDKIYLSPLALYYGAAYILGMVVRYFPSTWIALARQQRGDRIDPLVRRLIWLIQHQFPQMVLEFLRSPYDFEKKE